VVEENDTAPRERCIGCGALVSAITLPTHAYIDASPGCWHTYREVLAKQMGYITYRRIRQLTVDAYAAQHPGATERRPRQSIEVHLLSLYFLVEEWLDPRLATHRISQMLTERREFPRLIPPSTLGDITVHDVISATNQADQTARVEEWANSVWSAWSVHHRAVRDWLR